MLSAIGVHIKNGMPQGQPRSQCLLPSQTLKMVAQFVITNIYSSSLLRRPWAMFFVFPEGGFSTAVDLCKLPADFRPPFVAAKGRLAAELGREDCNKSHKNNLDSSLSRKKRSFPKY